MIILFHSRAQGKLWVIRKANIVTIEKFGLMVFVRFRLDRICNAGDNQQDANQHLQAAANALLPVTKDMDLSKPLLGGYYFRQAACTPPDTLWQDDSEPESWAKLVLLLQDEPDLTGVPMFFLLGFEDEKGKRLAPKNISRRWTKQPITGFELREGGRYRLRILQWCEPEKGAELTQARVICEPSGENLHLEGASDLVVGRYDIIEFSFKTGFPGYSELAIRAEPLTTDDKKRIAKFSWEGKRQFRKGQKISWQDWPRIYVARVPYRVTHNWARVALVSIFGLLGIALYLLAPVYLGTPYVQGLQMIGIFLALWLLGDFAQRFVRARDHVIKVNTAEGKNEQGTS